MIFSSRKRRRREQLRATPFPPEWKEIIKRNIPLFSRLPPYDRAELLQDVQVFLAEKNFEGCAGLEMTDEIRVTIAAQACILLLHRETDYYPELTSILVYPSTYLVDEERHLGGNIWEEGAAGRLGHTARRMGSLVLAWDEVKRGAADPADGHNLVMHEFAHQLDYEDSVADGAPALATREQYAAWARVMQREFDALRNAETGRAETVLDTYGATNPPEFFAVATEAFFERPRALKARQPELYDQLAQFFQQDPATYSAEPEDDGSSARTL